MTSCSAAGRRRRSVIIAWWPRAAPTGGFCRHAGLACFRAGQYAESLEHWRNLLAATESGSDDWLEAKYYQLTCLAKTDPAAARQVLKQFQVLYPEIKSAAWRDKFVELERQIQPPA